MPVVIGATLSVIPASVVELLLTGLFGAWLADSVLTNIGVVKGELEVWKDGLFSDIELGDFSVDSSMLGTKLGPEIGLIDMPVVAGAALSVVAASVVEPILLRLFDACWADFELTDSGVVEGRLGVSKDGLFVDTEFGNPTTESSALGEEIGVKVGFNEVP